jgi:hypothetical protein
VAALAVLFLLVVFDAALSGFRAAAGRCARIDKRSYYARAMLLGGLAGCLLAAVVGVTAVVLGARTSTPLAYWLDVDFVVKRLALFFTPVAAVASLLLAVRAIRSVDARSVASTLVFGPLTLLRPAVVAAGCAWAIADRVRADVALLASAACLGLLLVTPFLRPLVARASTTTTKPRASASG